jgi:hypothetical protein
MELKKAKEVLDTMDENLKIELENYDKDLEEDVQNIIECCCNIEQLRGEKLKKFVEERSISISITEFEPTSSKFFSFNDIKKMAASRKNAEEIEAPKEEDGFVIEDLP